MSNGKCSSKDLRASQELKCGHAAGNVLGPPEPLYPLDDGPLPQSVVVALNKRYAPALGQVEVTSSIFDYLKGGSR